MKRLFALLLVLTAANGKSRRLRGFKKGPNKPHYFPSMNFDEKEFDKLLGIFI